MPELTISISISANDYLKFYQGQAKTVTAMAHNGQRVIFPAKILKPFVTHDGIKGSFKLFFDNNGKIIEIKSLT